MESHTEKHMEDGTVHWGLFEHIVFWLAFGVQPGCRVESVVVSTQSCLSWSVVAACVKKRERILPLNSLDGSSSDESWNAG